MSFPGSDLFPGWLTFPGVWAGWWPPPGRVGRTVARRPVRGVSTAVRGSVPFRVPWRPKVVVDIPFSFDLSVSVSASMSLVVDVPFVFDVPYSVDIAGGSVGVVVDVPFVFDSVVSATELVRVDVPLVFGVVADSPIANWTLTDNFNRADGALGSSWVQRRMSGTTDAVIAGNAVQAGNPSATSGNNATNQNALIYSLPAASDNSAVEATLVSTPAAGYYAGIVVRSDAAGDNYVVLNASGTDTIAGIYTNVAGTFTRRVPIATDVFVAGDVMILEAVGNVFTAKRRRSGTVTTVASWTDSGKVAPVGSAYRRGGLYLVAVRSAFSTTYGPKLDDFVSRSL